MEHFALHRCVYLEDLGVSYAVADADARQFETPLLDHQDPESILESVNH